MPRPVGYGRPGTKVFPDGWAEAHAVVVDGTHDSTVTVGEPGGSPQWSAEAKATLTLPVAPAYTGKATITPVAQDGEQQAAVAEDVVPVRRYEVKLLHAAAGVEVDHVVTVLASPDPEFATGRRLKVTAVEKGSRRFSRVLIAVDAD